MKPQTFSLLAVVLLAVGTASHAQAPKPNFAKPPRRATVLFDGKSAAAWKHRDGGKECEWTVQDGELRVTPGKTDILTKADFTSYKLHVEFWIPLMADKKSQERGNSGVYSHGRYEIQVLDNFMNDTYKFGGCAAIYGQKDPDVNACLPPEQWQSYDITFTAPTLGDDGKVVKKPRITVVWNGIKVHDDVEIVLENTTSGLGGAVPAKGPILLQNHGNAVRYRNIWVVPMGAGR